MTTEPIKPCPLCGSEAKAYILGTYGQVKCTTCNLKLECDEGPDAAIAKWNKRWTE